MGRIQALLLKTHLCFGLLHTLAGGGELLRYLQPLTCLQRLDLTAHLVVLCLQCLDMFLCALSFVICRGQFFTQFRYPSLDIFLCQLCSDVLTCCELCPHQGQALSRSVQALGGVVC